MKAEELDYEPGVLRVLQSKAETKSFYNKIANVYDLLAEHSEQPMREAGLELLAAGPGEVLLEVGFGTGHCLVELARAVAPTGKVVGIDIAERMLVETQKLLDQKPVATRVELHCGDAEHLPFPADSFDGIFTSFTLELFDTPMLPAVLTEWRRVLKPGGRLVVVAVSKAGKQGLILRAMEWTHRHFPNLMDCRPIFVRRGLEACGFRVDKSKVRHMWVPVEIVRGWKSDSPDPAAMRPEPVSAESLAASGGSPEMDAANPLRPEDVVEVYAADDANEAEIVRAALRNEGIPCEIAGEQQAAFNGVPVTEVKLLARAQDFDRARTVIARERHEL
jgi:ubiquinone/menaquinone biosynthesis C-methylase UbiE